MSMILLKIDFTFALGSSPPSPFELAPDLAASRTAAAAAAEY